MGETKRDTQENFSVSEVRQMGRISKPDTHSGLRNLLTSSRPSPEYLLAFSSPQNISHLMSLRPLPLCMPLLALPFNPSFASVYSPSLALLLSFFLCHSLHLSGTHSNSNLHFQNLRSLCA